MRRAYQRRRDLVVERLGRIPGVRCPRPDGAFYAFPDVRGGDPRHGDAWPSGCSSITRSWSRPARRSVPESGGFLRLSYATSDEDLAEGLTRLEAGLAAARQRLTRAGATPGPGGAAAPYRVDWRRRPRAGPSRLREGQRAQSAQPGRDRARARRGEGGERRGVVLTGYDRFFSAGPRPRRASTASSGTPWTSFMAWFDSGHAARLRLPAPGGGRRSPATPSRAARILALACDARSWAPAPGASA